MALPNFFCVGAQKAGTTTLFNILRQHPDIYLPSNKEAWFFHKDDKYKKGISWYEREYFSKCSVERAVGEISPDYMYFEKVPERIRRDLGKNIRFIFILRNPADRAYSHYLMTVFRGIERELFDRAIILEKERIERGFWEKIHFSYVTRGKYYEQISRYLRYFSKKQMLFLIFEENIKTNINFTIGEVLNFLEVNNIELNTNVNRNPAVEPRSKYLRDIIRQPNPIKRVSRAIIPFPSIRSRVRKFIEKLNQQKCSISSLDPSLKMRIINDYFMDDIKKLEKLLERDLSFWYMY